MARPGRTAAASSVPGKVLAGWGNLLKILPTGAVFVFQFVNPVLTSNGQCDIIIRKALDLVFIGLCVFFCVFACFTDSYRDNHGAVHFGVATFTGLWPQPISDSIDSFKYRLRVGDFVHAFFSAMVFTAFSLLDSNTVKCLYPTLESADSALVMVLPPVLGVITGVIFIVFPYTRHGMGYPPILADKEDNS
ncbi:hypothetical protein F3Y22_tig00110044pilonHSYRG00421 [Hibiscus syriacus]|uniref:Uncharacterized protein n=1 Tax=Hibiscus syriacus TaxID=106335 RepID=A0A6A3BL17_HIBSY|nr:protein DMP2-like [Hibiscus syriacus]KAE8717686.1 hypothetical protein F3Y22_tig00110044pilonHSYRG00421 [Hibiscus syriacus]